MPDAATQTEDEPGSLEHQFKREVLDFVEGRGGQPRSEVLQWLGLQLIPAKDRPTEPKQVESEAMRQIRKERTEYAARLREGWEERNVGKPWLQFYPMKKPTPPDYHLGTLNSIRSVASQDPTNTCDHKWSKKLSEIKMDLGLACDLRILLIPRLLPSFMPMQVPDQKLRLEHIAALNKMKLAVEQRIIAAQAQLDSIRDRYELDDEVLAFEAEMRPTEEAVLWSHELDVLTEERRKIIAVTEYNVAQPSKAVLYPDSEEEEVATREPLYPSAVDAAFRDYIDAEEPADYIPGVWLPLPAPTPSCYLPLNSQTMPKKKRVLRQVRNLHKQVPRCNDDVNEIRERRRLALTLDATSGSVETVPDSWDTAMHSLLDLPISRDVEDQGDATDGASMDAGYNESDECDSEPVDPARLVCERSFLRGDPIEARLEALSNWMWSPELMPPGVRHSIDMAHAYHRRRNSKTVKPKIQLFDSYVATSDSGSLSVDAGESLKEEIE
ncbi:hypothetical protein C8R43DRAFT_1119262 [Mycena crocata]|nr:hypothetical protein C8R43DRAFT_1125162 [Mycena crocata]KAJ7175249.1 hypothetical protein C8R43DRAFT_1119262 [Mycena crocata]